MFGHQLVLLLCHLGYDEVHTTSVLFISHKFHRCILGATSCPLHPPPLPLSSLLMKDSTFKFPKSESQSPHWLFPNIPSQVPPIHTSLSLILCCIPDRDQYFGSSKVVQQTRCGCSSDVCDQPVLCRASKQTFYCEDQTVKP